MNSEDDILKVQVERTEVWAKTALRRNVLELQLWRELFPCPLGSVMHTLVLLEKVVYSVCVTSS